MRPGGTGPSLTGFAADRLAWLVERIDATEIHIQDGKQSALRLTGGELATPAGFGQQGLAYVAGARR
jgi:hypothetical protein